MMKIRPLSLLRRLYAGAASRYPTATAMAKGARRPIRSRSPLRWMALVGAVLALISSPVYAQQDLEDFFESSPGPLSESHAEIDGRDNCNDCHTSGRGLSNDKCLDCHDHNDLRDKIRAGKGFHSSAEVVGKKCESCHFEHKGRSYDIMGWRSVGGMDNFDHDLTDWPLNGRHASLDCARCHARTNRQGLRIFLGEADSCGSCHKDDQPHDFVREDKLDCARCHNERVWKPAKRDMDFDHNSPNDTDMPLLGSHEQVACGKCHPKSRFNLKFEDPSACDNCHKSPHDNHLFGTKDCRTCHTPEFRTLKGHRFDHGQETRFALTGAHSAARCYDCHTPKLARRAPEQACETCHDVDNPHEERFNAFGNPPGSTARCDVCHPASRQWSPDIFNHDVETQFDLTGKHSQLGCRECHRGKNPADFERFDPKTVGCMGCHAHENVHNREFEDSKCLDCHQMAGIKDLTEGSVDNYHGPESRFPLVQGHADVACEKCHINDVYLNTPLQCGARCHQDELHKGSLGDDCLRCHAGGQWDAVTFDHTEDTEWPLDGRHQLVPDCSSCHPAREYADTPKDCSAQGCHAQDDAHLGKLGTTCENCHKTDGRNTFNHNQQSAFKLDGAHVTTGCNECHASIEFKPQPTDCYGCHPEPDVHKGQYGTQCEDCHSTANWVDIEALHDVGDFSLRGSHDNVACVSCHKDNRPLQGSGNLCINCHRQDDIHANALSPRCGECHTQWSFAPARFDHSTVGCFLTGIHRTLPCYDCHKTGNFGGLSSECVSCHRDLAGTLGGFGGVNHPAQVTCGNCHNTNAWLPGNASGQTSFGSESICR